MLAYPVYQSIVEHLVQELWNPVSFRVLQDGSEAVMNTVIPLIHS